MLRRLLTTVGLPLLVSAALLVLSLPVSTVTGSDLGGLVPLLPAPAAADPVVELNHSYHPSYATSTM